MNDQLTSKKTLVFGVSLKPNRYSNMAVSLLTTKKVTTVGFGLKKGEVSGISVDTDLKFYDDIHTISLYISPKRQEEYYDYFLSLSPKRIIFNPGTENAELMKLLNEHNIKYEIACTLVLLTTDQY